MPSTNRGIKRSAAGALLWGAGLLACWAEGAAARPHSAVAAPTPAGQALVAQAEGGSLARGYSLPVVPVPPPPRGVVDIDAEMLTSGCPVQVRVLIVGESAATSLALVMVAGETESRLLKLGQTLRVDNVAFVVSNIGADQLIFQRGDVAIRCALPRLTR